MGKKSDISVAGAKTLYKFIWRHSSSQQVVTCLIALATLPLTLAPIELQRRIIDDAVAQQNLVLLYWLVGIYAVSILAQQVVKYTYNIMSARVAERMVQTLREQIVQEIPDSDPGANVSSNGDSDDGAIVAMLSSEVEPIGGFAGAAFAQLITEGGVLLIIFGYMLYTEFWLALVALVAFIPQALATPLVQNSINEKSAERISEVRAVGEDALAVNRGEHTRSKSAKQRIARIFDIRLVINRLKFGLKAVLNLLDHSADLAVLAVGGYMVINGQSEIGVVVAFLSGLGKLRSPWRTLIAYFRVASDAQNRFRLLKNHITE